MFNVASNLYFRIQGFSNLSDTKQKASPSLSYIYPNSDKNIFEKFSASYKPETNNLVLRKITAIVSTFSALVSTITQVFLLLFRMNRYGVYCIGRNAEKIGGHFISLFNEKYGTFIVNRADFHIFYYKLFVNADGFNPPKNREQNGSSNFETINHSHQPVPKFTESKRRTDSLVSYEDLSLDAKLSEKEQSLLLEKENLLKSAQSEIDNILQNAEKKLNDANQFLNSGYTKKEFEEKILSFKSPLKISFVLPELKIFNVVEGGSYTLNSKINDLNLKYVECHTKAQHKLNNLNSERRELWDMLLEMTFSAGASERGEKGKAKDFLSSSNLNKEAVKKFCSVFGIDIQAK